MTAPFTTGGSPLTDPVAALDAVSAFIRDLCGWHIFPVITETDLKVRGDGSKLLVLKTLQLVDVTSVAIDGVELDLNTVVDWSDEGVIERIDGGGWPRSRRRITVTFEHGYEACPVGLAAVAASLAKRWPQSASQFSMRKLGTASVGMSGGGGSGSLQPGDLTTIERAIIQRYALGPLP